jgi:hypothetical protein
VVAPVSSDVPVEATVAPLPVPPEPLPSGDVVDPVDALWLPAAGVGELEDEPHAARANVAMTTTLA